ncbi:hypothetical protein PR048_033285 [Dryococelus australis]|uniref:Uncharacterized protein n=1 Tax=Dryococelus australis TaxID=614101 RepID=A0ABQ9FZV8_9NEOP|nr:hypothetical protein PR048_033285 [Dryococelus australis]
MYCPKICPVRPGSTFTLLTAGIRVKFLPLRQHTSKSDATNLLRLFYKIKLFSFFASQLPDLRGKRFLWAAGSAKGVGRHFSHPPFWRPKVRQFDPEREQHQRQGETRWCGRTNMSNRQVMREIKQTTSKMADEECAREERGGAERYGGKVKVTKWSPTGMIEQEVTSANMAAGHWILIMMHLSFRLVKAVHDKASTFEINLTKKSLPLPAYTSTGALSDMRPLAAERLTAFISSLSPRDVACYLEDVGRMCLDAPPVMKGQHTTTTETLHASRRKNDKALDVRVRVARIALSLLGHGRAGSRPSQTGLSRAPAHIGNPLHNVVSPGSPKPPDVLRPEINFQDSFCFAKPPPPTLPSSMLGVTVVQWLDYLPPTYVNRILFLAESLPVFGMRQSHRTMPLVCVFSRGSPVFPYACIPALLHTHLALPPSALETSMYYPKYTRSHEHFTIVCPSHTQFSQKGRDFSSMQQPMDKRRQLGRISVPPTSFRFQPVLRINCMWSEALRALRQRNYLWSTAPDYTKHWFHTVFDTSWRTLAQSSPFTVTADSQCAVDIGMLARKYVKSSLQDPGNFANSFEDKLNVKHMHILLPFRLDRSSLATPWTNLSQYLISRVPSISRIELAASRKRCVVAAVFVVSSCRVCRGGGGLCDSRATCRCRRARGRALAVTCSAGPHAAHAMRLRLVVSGPIRGQSAAAARAVVLAVLGGRQHFKRPGSWTGESLLRLHFPRRLVLF